MYKIEQQNYGPKFTFGGYIRADEMRRYAEEAMALLPQLGKQFYAFVDMRGMSLLPLESQAILGQVQQAYRDQGLRRVALIVDDIVTKNQMQRVSKANGVYAYERLFSAQETPDWEKQALAWLSEGLDPDNKK